MKPSVFGRPSRRHVTWADRQRLKERRRRQICHELLESRQLLAGDYPSVIGVEINGGDAQRSTLESLRVQFDRPVDFEGGDVASAFEVRSLVDGGRVGVEATSVGDGGAIQSVLTTTLAIFLFAGSNVARWLTIVCYGLSVVFAVAAHPALFERGSIAAPLMLLLAMTNAAIPFALQLIPGMDDYFA